MPALIRFFRLRFGLPRGKAIDAILLLAYFTAVISFILIVRPDLILGHALLFVIPGMYLVWRYRGIRSHAFLTSIVIGIAVGTLMQVVAESNLLWKYDPVFPFLNWNGFPLEAILWYVVWSGFLICIYAVFFDRHPRRKHRHSILKHHMLFLAFGATVFTATVMFLLAYPDIFVVEHAYLVYGVPIVLVPMLIIFYIRRHVFGEIFRAALFLSLFALIYEIMGLTVGWWRFPGDYVGTITLINAVIPIEEVILWVALGSLSVLAWYEEVEAE